MEFRHGAPRGLILTLAMGLAGCGGNAPAPPPVNPYATGGNPVASAPPASQAPAGGQPASNPFGGPGPAVAPATASNPFGAPSGTPAAKPNAAPVETPQPEMKSPVAKAPPAAKPTPKPAAKPVKPVAEEPVEPAVAETTPAEEEMPKEPEENPAQEASAANVGFGGLAKAGPKKGSKSAKNGDAPADDAPEEATTSETPAAPRDNPQPATTDKSTWSLALDPAPAGCFAAPGAKLGFKMPSNGAIGPDFVESTRLRVLYPVTPGPFVALGLNDEKKQVREVFNLIDKKKVGQVRNLEFDSSKEQALSPDGKFFAGKPLFDSTITIFNISQNKPVPPIKLSGPSSKLVAFAGKKRLIFEDNKELHVYSLPDFKPQKVVKLGSWKVSDGWALSAGGRYFVAVTRQGAAAGLTVYDLDSGESAAVISLAKQPECQGVAFSVDGKQLAVLLGGDAPELRVWQVKTGASSGQFDLKAVAEQLSPRENYQGTRLEWFPDHRHVLIGGKAVYDSRDGKLLSELKSQPIYPVRVVSPDQLAVAVKEQLVTHDLAEVFKANAPPAPDPGTSEPVLPVPESKPVDRTAIVQVELEDVDWSVKPGKPPAPIQATARGVEIPQGSIYMGCLSQSPVGIGFVMYTSQPLGITDDGLPNVEPGTRFWLEPLDLKNGNKQKNIPLPPSTILMSVNQDGTLVCSQNADGLDRLDIWAVRDGSNKGSLAPYHDAPAGPEQRVSYAEFIDTFTLLTSAPGRLTLWDTGENKAIYEVEIGDLRPELSPARDYVAVTNAGQRMIYILDLKTGKAAGNVALSDLAGDLVSACGFHPEGRFFATLSRRIDGGELRVVDLNSGEVKKTIPLPISGQVLQWVGSDYVLIDGTTLVSISRECVVWNYTLPDGIHLRDSPDQRHWYIAADSARSNVYFVRGVDMPDETAIQRIGVADLRGKLLLRPGQNIDLDIEVTDPEGETSFADQLKNILTDRYLSARIKIVAGVPVTLRVRDNSDSGWSLSLMHQGKLIWTHEIDGTDGPAALLEFEPPTHAFPAGAELGAGQSALGIRGTK